MSAPHLNAELLLSDRVDGNNNMSPMQKAIGQTYQSTGQLAKLLPSGTVLSFQLLVPTLSKQGHCSNMNRMLTGGLVALCALSCFVLSFTDTFRDVKGKVRYGFATFKGLWLIDGGAPLEPLAATEYRIRFLDFVHAIVSAMIFVAIALFDQNVVSCFYPIPSEDTQQFLTALPVIIGVIGSMLFVSFSYDPSQHRLHTLIITGSSKLFFALVPVEINQLQAP